MHGRSIVLSHQAAVTGPPQARHITGFTDPITSFRTGPIPFSWH